MHIRAVCKVLEHIGPSGARDLLTHLPHIEASNLGRYCSRAVGLGMMTRTEGLRGKVKYSIFTVVPDWEVIAGQRRTTKLKPMPASRPSWYGVSSVFGMTA